MIKKITFILLSAALAFTQQSQAQEAVPTMLISAGGNGWDNGRSIVYDADGNIYVCGHFSGTATFGTTTLISAGGTDIFLAKYNSGGNLQWARRAGGTEDDAATDIVVNSTEVYITGSFRQTANFNTPSAFGSNEISSGNVFLAKYNSSGTFQWARRAGGRTANGIAMNGSEIYIAGDFHGTINFNTPSATGFNEITSMDGSTDIFLAKYNSSGTFQWARRAGGASFDFADAIAVNNTGIYITGCIYSTANFNNPSATGSNQITSAGGSRDIFVAKYNSSGTFQWARRAGGIYDDEAYDIAVNETEVYITGFISNTANFNTPSATGSNEITSAGNRDIFLAKYNSNGNFMWARRAGSYGYDKDDMAYGIAVNGTEVYITGYFQSIANFNTPSATGSNEITSSGDYDIFIAKYNSSGYFHWAKRAGGTSSDAGNAIAVNETEIYIIGYFRGTANFNTPSATGSNKITSTGNSDIFIAKYTQPLVYGHVYNDINENCIRESEPGISKRKAIINPGNIVVETRVNGYWYLDSLPVGTYTITYDTTGKWRATCPNPQTFSVTDPNGLTEVPAFGLVSTEPCAEPNLTINMPFMRPSFSNQKIYVNACNEYIATGALNSAYVYVTLDELLTVNSASRSYTSLGNNVFRFNLGNISPGQCVSFNISTTLSTSAILGQTLCMEAELFPQPNCVFDTTTPAPTPPDFTPCTLPWDKSSIAVEGWCQNDSIYFTITNTGELGGGDMDCFSPVRLYIDGVYISLDSIKLLGGQTHTLVFAGDGRTFRLEVDQHPLHPGNSNPNATVELCGDQNNWTPDLVNILPHDDADPIKDIYCGIVTGSYDPNDKTGYPLGITDTHFVAPNQKMEYIIRFQNTGTDTAFTVVIRDTLDTDFDIFSLRSGVSSHPYSFKMYGPRVLEWTFNNIMLPDSNVNEPESNGFVMFYVNQNKNFLDGTVLTNRAGIYFDFNPPIITNMTSHVIKAQIKAASWTEEQSLNFQDCAKVTYNNIDYTKSGTYWQVDKGSMSNPDTLTTLNVTIKNTKSSILAFVCDSYTAPDGQVHTTSGLKTAVIPNAAGCDSTISINLTIKEATSYSFSESVCDSYTAPDGQVHTTSGLKTAVIPNAAGCDSTVTINLTVYYTNDVNTSVSQVGATLTANESNATYQWFVCDDTNLPLGNEQSFTPNTNGSYYVVVSKNGCTDTSSCHVVNNVGIANVLQGVSLYPNPNKGSFTLSFGKAQNNASVVVKDILGKEIYSKNISGEKLNIDLETGSGVYFVSILTPSGESKVLKLVVE